MSNEMEMVRKACERLGWGLEERDVSNPQDERFTIVIKHDLVDSRAFVFQGDRHWRTVMNCRVDEIRPILDMLEMCGVK